MPDNVDVDALQQKGPRRPAAVFAVVLVPAVVAVSIVGYLEYELFDELASTRNAQRS
jgi:hypothetical protein